MTRLRLVGYAAVLGTLPYLSLKFAWLCGATIGIADPAVARDGSLFALNAATAAMDLVAIVVALACTHAWGRRLPAWLVLGPMWVGTGLLAPIAVGLPVSFNGGGPAFLEPWVQPLVYAVFGWQALTLLLAFVLYARVRWAPVFAARIGEVPRGATHGVQVVLGTGAAVLAFAAAALHLAHVAGSGLGLPPGAVPDVASRFVEGIHAALGLAAGVGILWLVHRLGARRPCWLPVALTWTGSGALFAWGLWGVVNTLGGTVLVGGAAPLGALADLAKLLAGLVIGVTAAMLLAERWSVPRLGRLVVERGDQPHEEHDRDDRHDHDLDPHARLRGIRSVHATPQMVGAFRSARRD